jgi:hypothetical protein
MEQQNAWTRLCRGEEAGFQQSAVRRLQVNHMGSRRVLRQSENTYHEWQAKTVSHFIHSTLLKVQ